MCTCIYNIILVSLQYLQISILAYIYFGNSNIDRQIAKFNLLPKFTGYTVAINNVYTQSMTSPDSLAVQCAPQYEHDDRCRCGTPPYTDDRTQTETQQTK